MAIYSLHHQPIGKSTQVRPHTSAAHVRYITRPSAASRVEAERMPDKPRKAAAFLIDAEDSDRKNARVADKLLLALPRELDAKQRAALVRGYAEEVTRGRAPWLAAFHDQGKDAHNPHAHLVVRDRDPSTGRRVVGLSEKGSTERLRILWEEHANRALHKAGRPERIDRRTLEAQGIQRTPTVHEGPKAQQMEQRGARPESRSRSYRNRPGSRLPHRQVDYPRIDNGRSRPAYNRYVRETSSDYWQALDADKQKRELEELRAIHHRPASVIPLTARRPVAHGLINQHPVNSGVLLGNFTSVSQAESPQTGFLAVVPPSRGGKVTSSHRITGGAGRDEIFEPSKGRAKKPAKPVEQKINHASSIGELFLDGKGHVMSVEDEERRRQRADLADARARESKSRAARNNALEKGYMRPDLAGPSIDKFYKNNGADKLKERFQERSGPSVFGVKRGNPLTKDGRAKRAEANHARRDIPDLWVSHDRDAKNLAAAERSYREKYGTLPDATDGPKKEKSGRDIWNGSAVGGHDTRSYVPSGQQSREQSPEDRRNSEAMRDARERLVAERHPSHAKSASKEQQHPSTQSLDDRKNNEAMQQAREGLTEKRHPSPTQQIGPAQDEKLDARRRMMDQMRDRNSKEKELNKDKGIGIGD